MLSCAGRRCRNIGSFSFVALFGFAILSLCTILLLTDMALSQGRIAGLDFMPVEDIRPGMRGVGKTVMSGYRISSFDVYVLGILEDELTGADRILIQMSGGPGMPFRGIAAGMSGSPVYIDGRLIGAISYAYEFSDPSIGLVTPILEMLQALGAEPQEEPAALVPRDPLFIKGRRVDYVFPSRRGAGSTIPGGRGLPIPAPWVSSPTGAMVMSPVATPLVVSGASGRGFKAFLARIERFGIAPLERWISSSQGSSSQGGRSWLERLVASASSMASGIPMASGNLAAFGAGTGTGAGEGGSDQGELLPGSAFGVQLVRGASSVTAIGTLTARVGDALLAFGHPFLARGNSGYFATAAYVHTVVPSVAMPFKVASPVKVIGTVTQDRNYGLLARLGRMPSVVPLRVRVNDKDQKIEKSSDYEIVRDELLLPDLAPACLLSSLDTILARIGPGTSRVRLEISSKLLPQPLVRENMYYSASDVSFDSLSEFTEAVDMITHNDLQEAGLVEVKADCEVTEARLTASIESVRLETEQVKPGGEISVEVKLRAFRGKELTKKLLLKVPEDAPPGKVTLGVRGGGMPSADEMAGSLDQSVSGVPVKDGKSREESFLDLLKEFEGRDRNNEIVAELFLDAMGYYEGTPPQGGEGAPSGKEKPPERPGERPVRGQGASKANWPSGVSKSFVPMRLTSDRIPQSSDGKGGDAEKNVPRSPIRTSVLSDYVIEGYKEVEVEILDAGEEHNAEPAESQADSRAKAR